MVFKIIVGNVVFKEVFFKMVLFVRIHQKILQGCEELVIFGIERTEIIFCRLSAANGVALLRASDIKAWRIT